MKCNVCDRRTRINYDDRECEHGTLCWSCFAASHLLDWDTKRIADLKIYLNGKFINEPKEDVKWK